MAFISLFASCEKEEELNTPAITGSYEITLPSFAKFDGKNHSFYASNGNGDFDELLEDWTFETWFKVENGTSLDTLVLNSSIVMEQRYVFSVYLVPANPNKPEGERTYIGIDYTKPNGVGEVTETVESDFELRYTKLRNEDNDDEIATMSTYDKNEVILSYDKWIHIAITRSSATGIAKLFINGKIVEQSDDVIWTSLPSVSAPNWSGSYRGGYISYMKGAQRKVRISRVARYIDEFTPNLSDDFVDDAETLFMLNLTESEVADENSGSPIMDVKGTYSKTCNLRQSNWGTDGQIFYNE